MSEDEQPVTCTGFTDKEVAFIAILYNLIVAIDNNVIFEVIAEMGMSGDELGVFLEKTRNES